MSLHQAPSANLHSLAVNRLFSFPGGPVGHTAYGYSVSTSSGPSEPAWKDRLGGTLLRTRLFALSYMPLVVIFALQSGSWLARGIYFVITLLLLVDGYRCTYGQSKKAERNFTAVAVKDSGSEVSGYLATYILPFISGPPANLWTAGAYLVYFFVAWVVYVNSDLLFINPSLYLLGWRIGQVTVGREELLTLFKTAPLPGSKFEAVTFAGGLVKVK